MPTTEQRVLTGSHFMNGDTACAEGALAAGCLYFGGYPITPSTEIAERLAHRLPGVGGAYVQMEDELGSIVSVIGAAWGGVRSMTATSGPGFSLMMESIGLAAITETPCVIVNVMRGGHPPVSPRWWPRPMSCRPVGDPRRHPGDRVLTGPCQEMFDLTLHAFNVADRSVTLSSSSGDEAIGHLTERVVIPAESEIKRVFRSAAVLSPGTSFEPFRQTSDPGPAHAAPGHGLGAHITSLTHDERGYPGRMLPRTTHSSGACRTRSASSATRLRRSRRWPRRRRNRRRHVWQHLANGQTRRRLARRRASPRNPGAHQSLAIPDAKSRR